MDSHTLSQHLTAILAQAESARAAGRVDAAIGGYDGAVRLIDAALASAQHGHSTMSPADANGLRQYRANLAQYAAHLRQSAFTPAPPSGAGSVVSGSGDGLTADDLFGGRMDSDDLAALDGPGPEAAPPGKKQPRVRTGFVTNAPRVGGPRAAAPARPSGSGAGLDLPPTPSAAPSKDDGGKSAEPPASPPPPLSGSSSSAGSKGGKASPSNSGGGPGPIGPALSANMFAGLTAPAAGAAPTGHRKNYAARASDLVYRALDVATQLVNKKDFKRAIDMLQHAIDDSKHEENVPAAMAQVESLCAQLRERFVRETPPRAVQDNPLTDSEVEVLRRAGTTSRILLPAWDDIAEGFPRENVWYPTAGVFTDDFTPQLAPSQVKHKAVLDRPTPTALPPPPSPASTSFAASSAGGGGGGGGGGADSPAPARPAAAGGDGAATPTPTNNTTPGQPPSATPAATPNNNVPTPPAAGADVNGTTSAPTVPTASTSPPPAPAAAAAPPLPAAVLTVVGHQVDPQRIKQSVVGDCAFVCSMIVCALIQQKFPGVRLLTSAIYPQLADGTPVLSRSGKYVVKMLVNGTTRLVVIDDRLPMEPRPDGGGAASLLSASAAATVIKPNAKDDEEALKELDAELNDISATRTTTTPSQQVVPSPRARRMLCTHSTDPNELWPSLLEKAFIKVCGGSYDWPGSNSATDLYLLSGWLPQFIALPGGGAEKAKGFDADLEWRKLAHAQPRGAVAVTINTPAQMGPGAEERLGLQSRHAYAVLDAREVSGMRLVKIKNPHAHAGAWKGRMSDSDRQNMNDALRAALSYTDADVQGGVFWMLWNDLVSLFSGMHLSWNPYLLFPTPQGGMSRPTRLAIHARFDYSDSYLLVPQVQLRLSSELGPNVSRRIHLVLARHIHDHREFREHPDTGNRLIEQPYLALHVYDVTAAPSASALRAGEATARQHADHSKCFGRRLQGHELPQGACVHRGVYRNSAYQTVSFTAAGQGYREFTVIIDQHLTPEQLAKARPAPFTFSLTAHTQAPEGPRGVAIRQIPYRTLPFAKDVAGQWAKGVSCGGRVGGATFGFNPQWSFTLQQPSRLVASIITPSAEPCVLHMVRHNTDRPPQHPTVRPTPWALRVDAISTTATNNGSGAREDVPFLLVLGGRGGVYSRHDSLIDSTLAACHLMTATSTTSTLSGPTPPEPPGAPPTPPPLGPPPADMLTAAMPRGMIRLVLPPIGGGGSGAGPEEKQVPVGVRWPQLDARPTRLLFCLAALASGRLAAPKQARISVKGVLVDPSAPLRDALMQANGADLWALADGPVPVLVVPGTDDMARTSDLSKCEGQAFEIAKEVLNQLQVLRPDEDLAVRRRALAPAEERATQLLLRIDGCAAPSDAIAAHRKALVETVQLAQDVIDALLEPSAGATTATGGGYASSPGAASPTAAVADAAERALMHAGGGVLPAGVYTVVASCWSKGAPGTFRLSVEAEEAIELAPVPIEGAGWHAVTVPNLAWPNGEALVCCQRGCEIAIRALFVPDAGPTGAGSGDDTPIPIQLALCEAGTGRPIVRCPWATACALPAVRLDGGAKYKIQVSGDASAAYRGRLVLRCFTSAQEAVSVQ